MERSANLSILFRQLRAASLALLPVLNAIPSKADEFRPALELYLETELRSWIDAPVIVDAIRAQNKKTAAYDQAEIDALDTQWRALVDSHSGTLYKEVVESPAADFLRDRVFASGGEISEVFVMDSKGLNVAASAPTSDYWQGDGAKFQQTYLLGSHSVHFGDIEYDASSGTFQGQISVSLVDPASGQPIGAITIAVVADALL